MVPRKAHFFDLDHTLCRCNVSFQFGRYLVKKSIFPFGMILPLLICYILCKRGWIGLERLHLLSARCLFQGKTVERVNVLVKEFLDENLNDLLSSKPLSCFYEAKARGEYTALLSNSPHFIVQQIAHRLGFDQCAGTEYVVQDGKFHCSILRSMEGRDKALFVNAELLRLKLKREDTVAYSDSILDLSFLESVGIPIVVNPDKKLQKYAQNRSWAIL